MRNILGAGKDVKAAIQMKPGILEKEIVAA